MKKQIISKRSSYLLLAVIISFTSCQKLCFHPNIIKGSGDVESEVMYHETFTKIDSKLGAKINIYESDDYHTEVSMQDNLLKYFETEVKNNVLNLSFGNYNVRTRKEITIDIYTPHVEKLSIKGAGDVNSEIPIETFELKGAGNIKCKGEVDDLKIDVKGAGNFDLYDLLAQNAYVSISGSGKVKVNAEEKLDVSIAGAGSVYYKGNPMVSKKISGLGSVVDTN